MHSCPARKLLIVRLPIATFRVYICACIWHAPQGSCKSMSYSSVYLAITSITIAKPQAPCVRMVVCLFPKGMLTRITWTWGVWMDAKRAMTQRWDCLYCSTCSYSNVGKAVYKVSLKLLTTEVGVRRRKKKRGWKQEGLWLKQSSTKQNQIWGLAQTCLGRIDNYVSQRGIPSKWIWHQICNRDCARGMKEETWHHYRSAEANLQTL